MISQSDQPQCDSATIEPTVEPIPPRYWWLKRIGVVAGVLFVILFALRIWWGWEANRRLQAEIDKIIAAGEPIYPEDFDPKEEVPNEQNAARLLIGADEATNLAPEQQELLKKVTGDPEPIRARLDQARGITEGNSEVFRRLRRARKLPGTDWGIRIRTPAINTSIPSYSGQRQLSKLMYVSAMYHHGTGNDAEAVEVLRDALAHSDSLNQQQTLIGQLVAWACGALTMKAIEEILPSLHIVLDEGSSAGRLDAASRSQIRSLLTRLMDERGMREGMRRAMMCERMYQVDIHKELMGGNSTMSSMFGWGGPMPVSVPDVAWRHALGPALTLDLITVLRETTPFVDAADATSFSGVPSVGEDSTDESGFRFLLPPHQSFLSGSFERSFELYFRLLARRRVAGTAVAIRLYEVDHGQRPESLAELVPDYLPHMLEDPFTEDGQALRYLPNAAHPVVYSIDANRVDDGGRAANQRRDGDIAFFLDGWREKDGEEEKVSPTSTQTGEDQKQIDGDEGEADEDNPGEEEP